MNFEAPESFRWTVLLKGNFQKSPLKSFHWRASVRELPVEIFHWRVSIWEFVREILRLFEWETSIEATKGKDDENSAKFLTKK